MAETSWPFDAIDTTETQFSQWARNIGEGVKGSPSTTDLKVTAPGTGMTVSLAVGQSLVRGHYYYNDAAKTLTITTANATNPRIDAVVLELDPVANTIIAKVVAGTAAASPVAPTLTQTDSGVYQQLLAYVSVAAATSTISAGNVSDARSFANGAGLYYKNLVSPKETVTVSATAATGTIGFDVATQADLYYTTNASANFTLNFRGNAGVSLNSLMAVGDEISVVFRCTNGTTAYYPTVFQIDGSAVTPKWSGGSAPTAGNASSVDVYSFNIVKTASTPTYQVFASQVKFA